MKSIYLLTTLNENYLPRLQVMPTSPAIHNPKDAIRNYDARNYGNYRHLAPQERGGSL